MYTGALDIYLDRLTGQKMAPTSDLHFGEYSLKVIHLPSESQTSKIDFTQCLHFYMIAHEKLKGKILSFRKICVREREREGVKY